MGTRVLDRNFVLQKQLERSQNRIQKEYKISERRTHSVAEECVSFAYQLLFEATLREKENSNRDIIQVKTQEKYFEQHLQSFDLNKNQSSNRWMRPQTARTGNNSTKTNITKRPSSAHPILSTDENIEMEDKKPVASAWSKVKQKVNDKELTKNSHHSFQDIVTKQIDSSASLMNSYNQSINRPKTADFYRKKQPEDQQAIYWSKKVRAVIARWDNEDHNGDCMHLNEIANKTITPLLQPKTMTESERRLGAFVRRFGSKYRTQMRPMTSADSLSKGGRKSFKISRSELASIHAEVSRRLKNTQMLIKKSRNIQANVEKYKDNAAELSFFRRG